MNEINENGEVRLKKQNRHKRHRENLKKSQNEQNIEVSSDKKSQKKPHKKPQNRASKSDMQNDLGIKEQNQAQINQNQSKKRHKKNKNIPKSLIGDEPWQEATKKAIEANRAIQEKRLYPLKNANRSDSKIRITPLGGLGEIGSNMTVFETENSAIIVDVGMSFPNENMLGVDLVIPDFSYVRKIKEKIKAIFITHAHEDHIGALPYFFKEFNYPIYATPLTLGMISNKFEEHELKAERNFFQTDSKT